MNVLVTGSNGFIGKNLIVQLCRVPEVRVLRFDLENTLEQLQEGLAQADMVYHLAGVNRPRWDGEFRAGNVELTARVCDGLQTLGRRTPVVFSSSIQVERDNPYGTSKRQAEEVLERYALSSGARCIIFRLKNVFGKWCRPNYNSVVATFCHNIARDLPITVSDRAQQLELVHVDDVVAAFIQEMKRCETGGDIAPSATRHRDAPVTYREIPQSYRVTLGRLAELIRSFRETRTSLRVPDFSDPFTYKLYGTYVSYVGSGDFAYPLHQRTDDRGSLAEFVKSPSFGQIFVSRTKPGIVRGNHYHHVKTEKFLVLEGDAVIRFRPVMPRGSGDGASGAEVVEYRVSGQDFRVLDIPPGYTHSIENIGAGELVTLFWASEVFDPAQPDTTPEEVQRGAPHSR